MNNPVVARRMFLMEGPIAFGTNCFERVGVQAGVQAEAHKMLVHETLS